MWEKSSNKCGFCDEVDTMEHFFSQCRPIHMLNCFGKKFLNLFRKLWTLIQDLLILGWGLQPALNNRKYCVFGSERRTSIDTISS